VQHITSASDDGGATSLPYSWLWNRLQQCKGIIALGKIAEYGVLKIFQRIATAPTIHSWKNKIVYPNHPTINASVPKWEYGYACSQRRLGGWLASEDWWVLGDSSKQARWFMLPVLHPSAAIWRGNDLGYKNTVPRIRRMIMEAH